MHSVALPGGIPTGDMSLKHSPSSPDRPEPLGRATFHTFGAQMTGGIGVGKCIPLCASQRTVVRMLLRSNAMHPLSTFTPIDVLECDGSKV